MNKKTYATLDVRNAMDFRAIARHMQNDGHKMGASRVRLIMIDALEKIVVGLATKHRSTPMTSEEINATAVDPEFQNTIAPFIIQAFEEREQVVEQ